MGFLDRHISIEHVTESGFRVGKDSLQHEASIGLCTWHHYGRCRSSTVRQRMIGEFGPSLADGRKPFEEHFGDEVHILIPTQDYMLELFADTPWPEYNLPRNIARLTRTRWIELNHEQTLCSQDIR